MKKTILIVDDESTIRWILKVALEVKDFSIVEASSGEEGIAISKQIKPDLVIMDYKMPDMNGWQATAEIKKIHPEAIVIGHTGYASEQNIQEGFNSGCNEILRKPVDLEEWEKTISKYL
ncbi:MAG: response regulator [Candidatus Margulisbacteria bacterium]|nr:response regulator [Candidatus Margulisiibacteriota bacterium]